MSQFDQFKCGNCGQFTAVCYTDEGVLGMIHGGCLCRECYVADGHPECPGCKEPTNEAWNYCPKCGFSLRFGGV